MSCIPVGLVAEFLENPICLENRTPRLSWRLDDARAGARQTAYRIAAASSAARLEAGDHDLWDTGRVMSAETLDIRYAGKRLPSRSSVFWRVMVWDKDGNPSPWSAAAHFEIGPFAPGDIAASWIGSARPRDKAGLPVPMFRKAKKPQSSVFMAASGRFRKTAESAKSLYNITVAPLTGWSVLQSRTTPVTTMVSICSPVEKTKV